MAAAPENTARLFILGLEIVDISRGADGNFQIISQLHNDPVDPPKLLLDFPRLGNHDFAVPNGLYLQKIIRPGNGR